MYQAPKYTGELHLFILYTVSILLIINYILPPLCSTAYLCKKNFHNIE